MPSSDLKWVELSDFRPGIKSDAREAASWIKTTEQLPAISSTKNTYGCVASSTGSLGPLPKLTSSYTPTPPDNYVNVRNGEYYIVGFHVTGPITGAPIGSGQQSELHLGWEWIKTAGVPNPHKEFRWERHQLFANPVLIDSIKSYTGAVAPTLDTVRGLFLTDVRMHPTTATNPGYPLVAGGWWDSDAASSFVSTYPNPNTPNLDPPLDISTALPPDIIVAHQGRLLIFEQRSWNHGAPGAWISNEQVWYTNTNLTTIQNTLADTFSTDRMTGIGVAKGVSSNELLIVKFQEGGFAVSGDVSDPTIIRLPGVMPTYGATTVPVYSKVGLVYGVLGGGVYVWAGGDGSTNIAQDLDDGFWHHADIAPFVNYHGNFSLWRDWIVAPNNWLFDTNNQGWWRITSPVPTLNSRQSYMHSAVDYTGNLYVAPPRMTSGQTGGLVSEYSYNTPGEGYYWESNFVPLGAPGKQARVREIVIETQGVGTVTVAVFGDVTSGPADSNAFAVNSSKPAIQRKGYAYRTTGSINLKVTVASSGSGVAAPLIHSIRVGYDDESIHTNAA